MRAPWGFVLCATMCACGGDEGTNPGVFDAPPRADAPLSFDATPPVDARTFDAGPGAADARVFDARLPDAMVGAAPVIRTVVITHAQPCVQGTASNVTVEIVATDVETPAQDLTYTGNIPSCGNISGRVSTLNCPQAQPYTGGVTVRDADNNSASRIVTISPCANTPDAGPL